MMLSSDAVDAPTCTYHSGIRIGHHDVLECGVMDSACLLANEVGLKQYLGAAEALTAKGDDVAVWTLTGLLQDVAVEIFADVHVGLHDGLDVVSWIPLASLPSSGAAPLVMLCLPECPSEGWFYQ